METVAPWLYAGLLLALPFALVRSLSGRLPDLREVVSSPTGVALGWTRALLMSSVFWFVGAVSAGFYFARQGDWAKAVLYPSAMAGLILVIGGGLVLAGIGTDGMTGALYGHMTRRGLRVVVLLGGIFYVGLFSFMALWRDGLTRALTAVLAALVAAGTVYFVRRLSR